MSENFLYHYTKFDGVHGILRDKCLWATDATATNDSMELKFGIKLLKSALLKRGIDQAKVEEFCDEMSDKLNQMFKGAFLSCVSSVSENLPEHNRDYIAKNGLLSQWRGYGSYAIKFEKKNFLEEINLEYDVRKKMGMLWAWHVSYFDSSGRGEGGRDFDSVFKGEIDFISGALKNGIVRDDEESHEKLFRSFDTCCLFTKHICFSEENEYRVITRVSREYDSREINFYAPGKSYVKFFDQSDAIRSTMKEVIVGPVNDPEQQKKQIEMMLERYGFTGVDVTISDVTFTG